MKFSLEETKILAPIVERLLELEYYEVTSIYNVLADLDAAGSKAIANWKSHIEQAVRLMNKELYHQLLNIFNPSGEDISDEYL